jgi:hypothetical protein
MLLRHPVVLLTPPTVDLLHEYPDAREVDKEDPIELNLEMVRRLSQAWEEVGAKESATLGHKRHR